MGEVYLIDDAMMSTLDELEQHPIHYKRGTIQVKMIDHSDMTGSNSTGNDITGSDITGNDITKNNIKTIQDYAEDKSITQTCISYFLTDFKSELLQKEFLENYSSTGKRTLKVKVNKEGIEQVHSLISNVKANYISKL